ncbi:leucine-rich repeat domain-containing protein [Prevotella sp.]|uniref:leucine-rich repeat domain-containing protein n=1 Tax=Prevotella sp. TaxID=59823 RepID=UPI0027E2E3E9|nr:leucine-rich repeat domain-containing protein [Prevotella sp.]
MHNIRQLYRKHFGRAVVYTLLSLFLCMAGAGKAVAAVEFTYKPQVKVISTNYTNSGTEVTLKLWMYNFAGGSSRFIKNRTVDLYIDDQLQQSLLLNNLWQKISNAEAYEMRNYVTSGPVGNKISISFNFKNIGTAQFSNLQIYQYSDNDGKGTQPARWCTIELKLSFDNSFSYYGHKISVRGLWQDNSGAYPITEYVSLDNTIGGYVRPTKLNVSPFDNRKMRLSWEIQDYNWLASKEGNWIIYKCENGKRERVGGKVYDTNFIFDIDKKKYNCSATYDVTFQPKNITASDTICGLTTSVAATGHKLNDDDVCQICNHSFFRYTTSDGKIVNIIINRNQFGANIVAHSVVDGKCVIEFDGPITKIPENAFDSNKSLTGDLVIPNSVTEIGEMAFYYCTGLNGTLTLSNKLETIGSNAFKNCSGFTGSLILPNSLTTIGKMAFFGCKGFKDLTLSKALSVIPEEAFKNCSSLTGDLVIPNSVKEIGNSAFDYCTGFNGTLTLSNKLETIGVSAFYGCTGFTGSLTLPSSVTTIGQSAFYSCRSFTKLELPNTLSVIPTQAFTHCRSLSGELIIPASVTEIGRLAFYDCQNLNAVTGQVTLPKSLKKIGDNVFLDTDNINTVNFLSLPEGISRNLGYKKKAVSLSDDSYISDQASGTVNEISYTRQMSNNWGTLVLPYSLTLTGEESYRLYAIDNMTGDELVLKQLNGEVAAGTPCVVKRNGTESELTFAANDAELNMTISDQNVGGMKFRSTYWTKDVNSGYVISKNSFWNVEELKNSTSVNGVKVNPFRAWLDGTSANAPAQLSMRIDGSTTGIDAIDALNDAEAEYYDLSGKRLDEPQKGVNIVRMKSGKTKKIIIK